MIESDPEDDLIEKASRPKYSRGPEMSSTPTYSMDTDISTLEAPTFSTLNQGPSQIMMMLRWDHPSNLIGKKVMFTDAYKIVMTYSHMLPEKVF